MHVHFHATNACSPSGCVAGYGGNTCEACAIGTFAAAGTAVTPKPACTSCAAGRTNLAAASATCGESPSSLPYLPACARSCLSCLPHCSGGRGNVIPFPMPSSQQSITTKPVLSSCLLARNCLIARNAHQVVGAPWDVSHPSGTLLLPRSTHARRLLARLRRGDLRGMWFWLVLQRRQHNSPKARLHSLPARWGV